MIYLRTKFLAASSTGSLVITIKPKAKSRFHSTAIVVYILQNTHRNKCRSFITIGHFKSLSSVVNLQLHLKVPVSMLLFLYIVLCL